MLTIYIIKGYPNGDLDFEVNGRPNSEAWARKGWPVKWKIKSESNVDYIADIYIKRGSDAPPDNTDIFIEDRPSAENGSRKKNWKATVNRDANMGQVYHYNIDWVPCTGGNALTCDPKISIMPGVSPFLLFMQWFFGLLLAFGGLFFVRSFLKKKN